jgi:hypothetical protein
LAYGEMDEEGLVEVDCDEVVVQRLGTRDSAGRV